MFCKIALAHADYRHVEPLAAIRNRVTEKFALRSVNESVGGENFFKRWKLPTGRKQQRTWAPASVRSHMR